MSPVLGKVKAAQPDVLLLHLHAGPTALVIRQAAATNLGIPIVAGSAMHQPPTAALVEPAELRGVCAETNASPISGEPPEIGEALVSAQTPDRKSTRLNSSHTVSSYAVFCL